MVTGPEDVGQMVSDVSGGAPESAVDGPMADVTSADAANLTGRTAPKCKQPTPSPNLPGSGECDFLPQSIDFEPMSGYAGATTPWTITTWGGAFGLGEINNCHPYCYANNLTVGVDLVGGVDPQHLQGEVIVKFPPSVAPIASGTGRNSLGWIYLDGPPLPFVLTAQLVVETTSGNHVWPAAGKVAGLKQFTEFKIFPIMANSFDVPLTNITGIGIRLHAPANTPAGKEWHGVVYIDHLQIRLG